MNADTGEGTVVLTSDTQLFEAPNWSPDGRWIVVNADGKLFRLEADNPETLHEISATGLPELNNDHLISPDGSMHFLSANDGHIYRLPWEGGAAVRVTHPKEPQRRFRHFLHGISADGTRLAYVGTEMRDGDEWGRRALWELDLQTGSERLVGDGFSPADGPEYGPQGLLYFNSEVASSIDGHAQIFRRNQATATTEQLTFDERVNWFPHPSPDGRYLVYLSYEPGTLGHPADLPVIIRAVDNSDGSVRDLAAVFGGQGTINVNSWSPDSRRFAFVEYPIDPRA
ncbi:biopolymer transporter Tol [Pseudarthrobacter phenanthrenivorans]|uniref:TolB family protein n=1 Tax=Pseudarthrobacter phenanthrenivorans TaxID=361575 RepID=UPI00344EDE24